MAKFTRGPDGWPVHEDGRRASYWEFRKELAYYYTLANFVRIIGAEAESLIDIGSAGCHYLEWFDWIPDRVALDLKYPLSAPGIRPIKADFLEWEPDKVYDVALCCQVLEHIPDAEGFARKLLGLGKRLLISVPHMWPKGSVPSHVHDPVSAEMVEQWFGRPPSYSMTVREPFAEERLLCFFNVSGEPVEASHIQIVSRLVMHPLNRKWAG